MLFIPKVSIRNEKESLHQEREFETEIVVNSGELVCLFAGTTSMPTMLLYRLTVLISSELLASFRFFATVSFYTYLRNTTQTIYNIHELVHTIHKSCVGHAIFNYDFRIWGAV